MSKAFSEQWSKQIAEVEGVVKLFVHDKTKAEVLVISNSDREKAFAIGFKTLPSDSTGVAHILEHSVLNGSENYPVKEPFVTLIKTSLNTYLNAFTYPDRTVYPVASQNLQDFHNLIEVYLDAVFKPLIEENILKQEGWRYVLDSPDQEIKLSGVVFNEMKGAIANPDRTTQEELFSALFPNSVYDLDSGGDPKEIPNLTFEKFKQFHQKFYHPSNCRVVVYGDGDQDEILEKLAKYFDGYELQSEISGPEVSSEISSPVEKTGIFAASEIEEENGKGISVMAWALPRVSGVDRMMWRLISYILAGSDAAPLDKALMNSGLGDSVMDWGYDSELLKPVYAIGLRGVLPDKSSKMGEVILEVLEGLSEEIKLENIEAALNSFEFNIRKRASSTGRGVDIATTVIDGWFYGDEPLDQVEFEADLAELKRIIKQDSDRLSREIKQHLIDNTHRVLITLKPDSKLKQKLDHDELASLRELKGKMSQSEISDLVKESEEFKKWQEREDSEEELAVVPRLSLSDLDREGVVVPQEVIEQGDKTIYFHDQNTQKLVHINLAFGVEDIDMDLIPYLGIYNYVFDRLGTKDYTYDEFSLKVDRNSGGIWSSIHVDKNLISTETIFKFVLSGRGFERQTRDIFDLMRQQFDEVNLDQKQRVLSLLKEQKAQLQSQTSAYGHAIAYHRAVSGLCVEGWIEDQLEGISYLQFITELLNEFESKWESLLTKLESIKLLLQKANLVVNVTAESSAKDEILLELENWTGSKSIGTFSQGNWEQSGQSEGWIIPDQVNYVATVFDLHELGYKPNGSLLAASRILYGDYLWREVRVKGGAYGAFFKYGLATGIAGFTSYRDPNVNETVKRFKHAGKYLTGGSISQSQIEGAIISAIGGVDSPESPSAAGWGKFIRTLSGYSDQVRQQRREQLLGTTREDLSSLGSYLSQLADKARVVVVGSQGQIVVDKKELQLKTENLF